MSPTSEHPRSRKTEATASGTWRAQPNGHELRSSALLDVLLVDDEPATRISVAYALADAGHHVTEASDGEEARALIEDHVFDVAICDIHLPKLDGLSLFRALRQKSPNTAVILMTAYAAVSDAVASLREGAYDYVIKPFDADDFTLRVIGRIAERRALRQELEQARVQLASRDVGAMIVGHSPSMVKLLDRLDTIAQSEAPVLVTGESGSGKELVARTIHARSKRRGQPFVSVHCSTFNESLIEAELFGHERGALDGAGYANQGRFRAADGGTLFLHEVGELPLPAQAKLLRVLQEGTVDPLGMKASVPVDVRVVSASSQNLQERVSEGKFREDLFHRLNVLDLTIPPLRDRKGDLPLLLEYFLTKLTPRGKVPPGISPRAWSVISAYDFPGNVREFAHAIERALVLAHGSEIDVEHLPPSLAHLDEASAGEAFRPLAAASLAFERSYIERALTIAAGKPAEAAELLGLSRSELREKLQQHGIGDDDA